MLTITGRVKLQAKADLRRYGMKLPMMSEGPRDGSMALSRSGQDEDTKVDRLPAGVRPGVNGGGSQQGQTRVTFVDYESIDDE